VCGYRVPFILDVTRKSKRPASGLFNFAFFSLVLQPRGGNREILLSVPGRERAAVEEGLGSPLAEVDGEGDAVAVEAGEDEYLFAGGMFLGNKPAEDGAHFFGEENGAAPAVGDAHVGEGGVQMADAVF